MAIFDRYRSALLRRDGETAADLVSANTVEWYDEILTIGRQATAEALLEDLELATALSALPLRARLGTELSEILGGRRLIVRGIEEGMVGAEVGALRLHEVLNGADGDAFGLIDQQPVFRFVDEDGWKIDLEYTMTALSAGMSEAEMISVFSDGFASTRQELFEFVAEYIYGWTWEELSRPPG